LTYLGEHKEDYLSRNIVLCFDGTNNEYSATTTNVVRIYALLDRNRNDQLAYYQPGIGTFAPPGVWGRTKRWIIRRLDLAIAWLLEHHVTNGYRFLMRYSQPEDKIFIFGFSRGAYAARVLVSMVHSVGLLTSGNEELVPFAWKQYREGENDPGASSGFKSTFSREVRIHFLGLWDTVSTIGWFWSPQHLPFTGGVPTADVVRHAIALDERRGYYGANLWTFEPADGQDIMQVWFPGVHADVGGGYPEPEGGLSKISLRWMVEQSKLVGLHFNEYQLLLLNMGPTSREVAAPIHNSLKGIWKIVDVLPQRVVPRAGFGKAHWTVHLGHSRVVPEGSHIHESVFERQRRVPAYQPGNFPKRFVRIGAVSTDTALPLPPPPPPPYTPPYGPSPSC
jgi:hypothetical protein